MILAEILTDKVSETKNDYDLYDMKTCWLRCQLTGIRKLEMTAGDYSSSWILILKLIKLLNYS